MASNVYFSVCTNGTGNLLSGGSPSIVVDSSGNATVTLNGASYSSTNIGQGVAVEYNSIVSYIDSITDSTHFHLVTALGASASAQTSTALTSVHHVFASLSAAEAGAATLMGSEDLVSLDVVLNIACYVGSTEDSENVNVDGFGTPDSTRYVRIFVPTGGTQSISNNRHQGVLDRTNYYSARASSTCITLTESYTVLEGLQVCTNAAMKVFVNGDYCRAINCIFAPDTTTVGAYGLRFQGSGRNSCVAINCITISCERGFARYYDGAGGTLYCYNCLATGCTTAGFADRQGSSMVCTNCVSFNNADDFQGTFSSISYCASDDVDGTSAVDISPGATESDGWAAAMTDYANGDFTPVSNSPLIDAGTSLSSYFTTDIKGTSRPQGTSWDIGAFEYVASGEVFAFLPVFKKLQNTLLRR